MEPSRIQWSAGNTALLGSPGDEPYYPINDARNQALYARYADLMAGEPGVYCCGRLAEYRYYDMDRAMENALAMASAF